ncbi:MAG: hypothetical protein AB1348_07200 [Nitrospirota bacterium]
MKVISWALFGLAVASFVLGILTAAYLLPFTILSLTPGGYLRVTCTLLLFAITLYVLKKL